MLIVALAVSCGESSAVSTPISDAEQSEATAAPVDRAAGSAGEKPTTQAEDAVPDDDASSSPAAPAVPTDGPSPPASDLAVSTDPTANATTAPPATPTPAPTEGTVGSGDISANARQTPSAGATEGGDEPSVAYAPGAARAIGPGGPLDGLRIGLIANPASRVGPSLTIDLLVANPAVEVIALFAPEHGPRGDLAAGESVPDGIDTRTGTTVHSLYGATRQPTPSMLDGLDALVYDLQGAGARFYTYISTMGLAMQAAADADIAFVVLDRPNPLGGRQVTGPVLDPAFTSFVGQYPIPSVHGLTAGELARAIVAEGWLPGLEHLDLRVVEMRGWRRDLLWNDLGESWVPPSPGLATIDAAIAYPGTVLFEATSLSYGRGTPRPFEQIGAPWLDTRSLLADLAVVDLPGVEFEPVDFTPQAAPPSVVAHAGSLVRGIRWRITDPASFDPVVTGLAVLVSLRDQAAAAGVPLIERPDFFDLLAGSDDLRTGIERGGSLVELTAAWAEQGARFATTTQPYYLYD